MVIGRKSKGWKKRRTHQIRGVPGPMGKRVAGTGTQKGRVRNAIKKAAKGKRKEVKEKRAVGTS